MNLRYLLILSIVLFFSGLNAQSDEVYYEGQLWVQLSTQVGNKIIGSDDKISVETFSEIIGYQLAQSHGLIKVRKPFYFAKDASIRNVFQLFFNEGEEDVFLQKLEQLSAVHYAERIPIMRPTLTPNDLGPETGTNNQWSLWKIDAQQAWDITTGDTQIKVAIVDDAVLTTHPDLQPNLLPGYDVADNDNDPMPNTADMSHGTHVAGIVGAATNNNQGVASIGFNIKIIPVKSSNLPEVVTDAYSGLVWAYENDADVINMSWGGSGFSQTAQNIVNAAYAAGSILVAAAGNDGVSSIFYPAGYNNVISVASSTTTDAKSSFSNFGNWVDVTSPGSSIRSTYISSTMQPAYANLQGTSMASPLVAGLVGLVWSVNPEMSKDQVINCVVNATDNIDVQNPSYIGQLGTGRINAYQSVLCALSTINAPPLPFISADNTVSCPGGIIQFFGSSLGGLADDYSWSFPGGNPSSSTLQNPTVSYASLGNFNVELTVTNAFGSNVLTNSDFIEISSNGIDQFFNENFENGTFADNGWNVSNPDNGISWEIFNVAGSVAGTKAARVNLYNYNSSGQRDGLISPLLDFSGHTNVELNFEHAHRRRSQNFSDSLIVYVSTDGGNTFPNRVFAAAETGNGSFATGSILNSNFIPASGTDWCFGGDIGSGCFTVDLSDFDGETNVKLKFETYNATGNNIYVDNIGLSGNCLLVSAPPIAGIGVESASVCQGQSVQFFDQSINVPSNYSWSFPGGIPSQSTLPAPQVTYAEPGVYSVTLVVSNAFGSDELVVADYITVSVLPNLVVENLFIESCSGQDVLLEATGADNYSWSPNIGLSSTVGSAVTANINANLVYTVTGTTNGCAVSEEIEIQIIQGPAVPEVVSQNDIGFVVTAPVGVQGHYDYLSNTIDWGNPSLATLSIAAPLVIARSAEAADSTLCTSAINAAEIEGKIAVIYRGGCQFGLKALNAQNAGAVGVIIVNSDSSPIIEMGPGDNGASVTIPAIMVSNVTGAWLNSEINNGVATAVLGQYNGGGLTICPGETLTLAAPGGLGQYEWTNGTNTPIIEISEAGTYAVSVFAENGCPAQSQSYTVNTFNPTQPVISLSDNILSLNVVAVGYQWFYNGEEIEGATFATTTIIGAGDYSVTVTYSNGCSATSEFFEVLFSDVGEILDDEITIFPNPASDFVNIVLPSNQIITDIRLFSTDGKMLPVFLSGSSNNVNFELNISALSSGLYLLEVETDLGVFYKRLVKP
jgi:serine protease